MSKSLPSEIAARDLISGRPGAAPRVATWTLVRAGLIGTGLYLAGERKNLMKYALAGALSVEVFVLLHVWKNRE